MFDRPSNSLEASLRARTGLVTHQSFLYPNLTARENLVFYADLYGRRRDAEEISTWLQRVGLARAADDRVRTFSRGMEQRLTLARALLNQPDALLMDEPFAALDPEGVALTGGLLREARERGCALLLTAHQELAVAEMEFDCYEIVRGRLLRPPTPIANGYILSERAEPCAASPPYCAKTCGSSCAAAKARSPLLAIALLVLIVLVFALDPAGGNRDASMAGALYGSR